MKIVDLAQLQAAHQEELLRREVAVLKHLKHPGIVAMHDVFKTPHHIYLVLELVTGGELLDLILSRKRFSEREARAFFQQMVAAVHYCHIHGIAHRDLKPENILVAASPPGSLAEFPTLKISDFGLATIQRTNADGTAAGLLQSLCGTPDYVSPEVLSGGGYSGFTADVWSLGVILYVMLAGYPPFNNPSVPVMFEKIKSGEFAMDPVVPAGAAALIRRVLVVDPAARATLEEIAADPWFTAEGWDPSRLAPRPSAVPTPTPSELSSALVPPPPTPAPPPAGDSAAAAAAAAAVAAADGGRCAVDHATQFRCAGAPREALERVVTALQSLGAAPTAKMEKLKATGYLQTRRGLLAYAVEVTPLPAPADGSAVPDDVSLVTVRRTRGDTLEYHARYHSLLDALGPHVVGHDHACGSSHE